MNHAILRTSALSGSSGDVLQMRFLLPDRARTTHPHGPDRLRDGSLDTRSLRIGLEELLGLFLLSPLFQSQVLGLGTNRDGATRMAKRLGTERSRWTDLAVGGGEFDLDHLVFPAVNGRSPTAARVPLRARGLVVFPIDEKVVGIEASVLTGLPSIVLAGWSHQVNQVVLLALHQERMPST